MFQTGRNDSYNISMNVKVEWPRKLRILVVPPNHGGCAYYRSLSPMQKLLSLYGELVDIRWDLNPLGFDEKVKSLPSDDDWPYENMKWADVIMVNNISNYGGPYTVRVIGKAKEFGKFVHFDTDDLLTELYPEHKLYQVYTETGLSELTKFMYYHADLVTVTQRKFLERIKPFCRGIIAVIKNAIDYELPAWNMPKINHGRRTHIGWAGGIHHRPDVLEFASVPHLVNQKVGRERLFWDFYGMPNAQNLKDKPQEQWQIETWTEYRRALLRGFKGHPNWAIHNALPPDKYGQFYANMDLAIAPLKMNPFNDSKSEIKVAECHSAGELVLMFDGTIKKVEDVVIGDLLMGPDSQPRKVLNLITGKDKLVEVIPNRGKPFTVTKEHILCLKHNLNDTRYGKHEKFKEVKVCDYENLSYSEKQIYKLYRSNRINFGNDFSLPLEPYFLGIMLGDGNLSKGSPRITTVDDEIKDYFSSYCRSLEPNYKLVDSTKKNSKAKEYSFTQGYSCGPKPNKIMEKFESLNLKNKIGKDKNIPHQYKVASEEDRLQLLAGLIDSDGCLIKNSFYQFDNISINLIKDISFIGRSLGFYVSEPSIKNKGKHSWYRIYISGDVERIPVKVSRKKIVKNGKKRNRDCLTTGFSLKFKDYEESFYGFQVDGDNKYLMGDFLVTHNCGRYKVPLICSDVGCYDESIVDGETGILIPVGASKSYWAKKISDLVKKPSEIKRMGNNLHKLTEEYFDLNKVVGNRILLYDRVFEMKNIKIFEGHNDKNSNGLE